DAVSDVDVVLDTVGFDVAERSLDVLKPGGVIVGIVTPPPFEAAALRQIKAKFFGSQPDSQTLTQIAKLIDAGSIRPHVQQVFPFQNIHDALQLSQGLHVTGKLSVSLEA